MAKPTIFVEFVLTLPVDAKISKFPVKHSRKPQVLNLSRASTSVQIFRSSLNVKLISTGLFSSFVANFAHHDYLKRFWKLLICSLTVLLQNVASHNVAAHNVEVTKRKSYKTFASHNTFYCDILKFCDVFYVL